MSDYDFRPGGSLKLKGGVAEGGIVKKGKSQETIPDSVMKNLDLEKTAQDSDSVLSNNDRSASGSGRNSPALASSSSTRKTEAEKRFEEVQKRRLEQKIKKLAHKTHKDRVNEFNATSRVPQRTPRHP